MLKLIMFLCFLMPICFMNNMFWMVQNMLFFYKVFLILFNFYNNFFVNISYFLGCDLLSYILILLSVWISCLMMMAIKMWIKM